MKMSPVAAAALRCLVPQTGHCLVLGWTAVKLHSCTSPGIWHGRHCGPTRACWWLNMAEWQQVLLQHSEDSKLPVALPCRKVVKEDFAAQQWCALGEQTVTRWPTPLLLKLTSSATGGLLCTVHASSAVSNSMCTSSSMCTMLAVLVC
jgi:hypothetical protein